MSSIWTPDGEHSVDPSSDNDDNDLRTPPGFGEMDDADGAAGDAETARLADLQRQLAETPAEIVIANHCFGLFELAALHLSQTPPQLDQAQLAIDALGALAESLDGRLGDPEPQLREGLAQLRMAFVTVRQGMQQQATAPEGEDADAG
jgi:hypothetical protein